MRTIVPSTRALDATGPSVAIYLRGPFFKEKGDRSKFQEPGGFNPNLPITNDITSGKTLNIFRFLLHKGSNKGISQATFMITF